MLQHPSDPGIVSADGVAAVASAAEDAGFDGIGFTDHPAPPQVWLDRGGHDALDPFVAMAYAAGCTSTIRLISNVVVLAYRNPLIVAKMGATLDLLSGGRLTLAVGAGYLEPEFRALGVDFAERAALLDEGLDVVRRIWTEDAVHIDGRHFTAEAITATPRPVTEPHPPIWVGGNGAAARRRVVQHGAGWCPFPAPAALARYTTTMPMETTAQLSAGIEDLRRRATEAGRDPDELDVAFANSAGGSPGDTDFGAEANLAGLTELADLGVTWAVVQLPGDSLEHVLEAIARFGDEVISPHRSAA